VFAVDLDRFEFENVGNGEIQLKQIMNMEQHQFIRKYLKYKRNTTKRRPKNKNQCWIAPNDYHDVYNTGVA